MERDGLILVYDITNPESFRSMDSLYQYVLDSYTQLQQLAGSRARPFPAIVIFGNKTDKDSLRKVSRLEAERYASDKHCPYLEGSALKMQGV